MTRTFSPFVLSILVLIPADSWGDHDHSPPLLPASGAEYFGQHHEGEWQLFTNATDRRGASTITVVLTRAEGVQGDQHICGHNGRHVGTGGHYCIPGIDEHGEPIREWDGTKGDYEWHRIAYCGPNINGRRVACPPKHPDQSETDTEPDPDPAPEPDPAPDPEPPDPDPENRNR